MQSSSRKLRSPAVHGLLALVAMSAVLVALPGGKARAAETDAVPETQAHGRGQGWAQHREQWARHRAEWMRARLDREANRLEIAASQQAAWQAYAQARLALGDHGNLKRPEQWDAATMAQYRAQRVQAMAQKLGALADATGKLEAVLSPDQRKTLDEISRGGNRWHGQHGWHRGWDRGHDGMRRDGQRGPTDGTMRGPGHAEEEAAPSGTGAGPAA
jgi:hypothetical protein